jgi:hypothetical protein
MPKNLQQKQDNFFKKFILQLYFQDHDQTLAISDLSSTLTVNKK